MPIFGDISTSATKYLAGAQVRVFKLDHMHELCHVLDKCTEKRTLASALRERWVNLAASVTVVEEIPLGTACGTMPAGHGMGLRTRMGLG
jgi:hypothetical protein